MTSTYLLKFAEVTDSTGPLAINRNYNENKHFFFCCMKPDIVLATDTKSSTGNLKLGSISLTLIRHWNHNNMQTKSVVVESTDFYQIFCMRSH